MSFLDDLKGIPSTPPRRVPTTPQVFGLAGQTAGTAVPVPSRPTTTGSGGGNNQRPPRGGGAQTPALTITREEAGLPSLPGQPDPFEQMREWQREQERMANEIKRQSAYDFARELARAYDLGEGIVDRLIDFVANKGYTDTAIRLAMQDTPEYKERFAGIEMYRKNFAEDIAAGRKAAPLTPADYIKAEKDYQEILNRYGLQPLATRGTYAKLIGGDVSAAEVTDRIVNVYDKIRNADDVLKEQIRTFFPMYNESDFAYAMLTGTSPEDMANVLKNKLSGAEISSEAARAGVGIGYERAMELQSLGVSRSLARAGYSNIATQQRRLGMLGSIYETDITDLQTELEAEQFQGLASQRRKRLQERETAEFSAKAGTSQVSLAQQAGGSF